MNKDLYKSYYKKIIDDTIKACKQQASTRANSSSLFGNTTNQSDETAYTRKGYHDNTPVNIATEHNQKSESEQFAAATILPTQTLCGESCVAPASGQGNNAAAKAKRLNILPLWLIIVFLLANLGLAQTVCAQGSGAPSWFYVAINPYGAAGQPAHNIKVKNDQAVYQNIFSTNLNNQQDENKLSN